MKYPPRWVFDIWNNSNCKGRFGVLRICGTERDGLDELFFQTNYSHEDAEKLFAVAWALYISDLEESDGEGGVLNEKTKFALAGFLKAGAGHVMEAENLILNLRKEYHNVSKDPDKKAVVYALKQAGFVQ